MFAKAIIFIILGILAGVAILGFGVFLAVVGFNQLFRPGDFIHKFNLTLVELFGLFLVTVGVRLLLRTARLLRAPVKTKTVKK